MLPGELSWVLNLLGFNWPDVNEDDLVKAADGNRKLAGQVRQAAARGADGHGVVTSVNAGASVDAFSAHWQGTGGPHLERVAQVYDLTADGIDAIAAVVVGMKGAVIAQLVALAAEVAAAAAASVVTFGISDAAGLAATAATRFAVREIIGEAKTQVLKMIRQLVIGEGVQALASSTADLLSQGVGNYAGTQHGISLSHAAGAGVTSAVAGAEGLATVQGGVGLAVGLGQATRHGLTHPEGKA
jgi:hypothetical protein